MITKVMNYSLCFDFGVNRLASQIFGWQNNYKLSQNISITPIIFVDISIIMLIINTEMKYT